METTNTDTVAASFTAGTDNPAVHCGTERHADAFTIVPSWSEANGCLISVDRIDQPPRTHAIWLRTFLPSPTPCPVQTGRTQSPYGRVSSPLSNLREAVSTPQRVLPKNRSHLLSSVSD